MQENRMKSRPDIRPATREDTGVLLDWNEPSIRFYESLGAVRMEEWRLFRVTGEALGKLALEAT